MPGVSSCVHMLARGAYGVEEGGGGAPNTSLPVVIPQFRPGQLPTSGCPRESLPREALKPPSPPRTGSGAALQPAAALAGPPSGRLSQRARALDRVQKQPITLHKGYLGASMQQEGRGREWEWAVGCASSLSPGLPRDSTTLVRAERGLPRLRRWRDRQHLWRVPYTCFVITVRGRQQGSCRWLGRPELFY